jgi:Zn-dependent protease
VELLNLDCQGHSLRLEGSMAGWQLLYWNNTPVSRRDAAGDFDGISEHQFELQNQQGETVLCRLETEAQWDPVHISYRFYMADKLVTRGEHGREEMEKQVPQAPIRQEKRAFSIIGLGALGLKLLKSAKIIKVVMAGASLAAYSWFFSLPFALALIFCLVVHEYGHIRAMKHFGMKTKGIYLIPFVGGLALSDARINTRWQDVCISMMGPFFGFALSLLSLVAYWLTGSIFFAGLSAFNALLNLFNLLPILPLDGGHILKSIAFSMNSLLGLLLCGAAAAGGIWLSYHFGLALLGFLLIIGSVEVFFEWRGRHHSLLLPLDRYGQAVSALWYIFTVGGLVAIIWYFHGMGDALLGLPLKILQS